MGVRGAWGGYTVLNCVVLCRSHRLRSGGYMCNRTCQVIALFIALCFSQTILTAVGFLLWTCVKAPTPEGDWQTGVCPMEEHRARSRS